MLHMANKNYKEREDKRIGTTVLIGYHASEKRIRKYICAKNQQVLKKKVRDIKNKLDLGLNLTEKFTFEKYAQKWKTRKYKKIAIKTQLMYETVLNNHCDKINSMLITKIKKMISKKSLVICMKNHLPLRKLKLP